MAAQDYAASLLEAGRAEMTVIAQREELIAWYERRGFRRTGERVRSPRTTVDLASQSGKTWSLSYSSGNSRRASYSCSAISRLVHFARVSAGHRLKRGNQIGLAGRLVGSDPAHSREAHR